MASLRIPEQKIILVGEFGVGKSSLFRRFMSNTFVNSSDRKVIKSSKIEKYNNPIIITFF
jgi:GTPase SAR1 family protein